MYWIAGIFAALLGALANGYGYHRDEMYFLASGRRLDWGYADQPPLTPLLARAMLAIDADSLIVLRLPAIAAATVIVICAGLAAKELGGGRIAQVLASGSVASAALVMVAGHTLGTTVIDLAVWSGVLVAVLRLLRPESEPRTWLLVGLLAGVGLQNKALMAVPLAVLAAAVAVLGPRKIFATRYFALALAIATLIVLPYLCWQAAHGWPQWEVSRAVAGGSSGTSDTPLTFVLLQFGLIGPLLVPLWLYGLWWLARRPRYRAFALTYGLLFVVYGITGGKAYYLGGMYPLLLAAGAVGIERWLAASDRSGVDRRTRRVALGSVVVVTAVGSALLFLPVLPVTAVPDSPVLAVNYDAGETIGWPDYVRQIAEVRSEVAPDAELLTANYGEAAAIEHFGTQYGLPTPHSGHNAYWWWGPPTDGRPVITIGLSLERVQTLCAEPELVGRLDNGLGVDNDEQNQPMFLCRTLREPWSEHWPMMRHIG
ncbi:glycosyltransferase family 39 protein [Nocardia uniformis]|uniref:Glycosyltransferase family 39 protein n=1 Tax=Nocardia uniformis TaxID=53432 RepID=A0A849BWN2_9NOCA|nr:glycosyltransferase family 39 protein [Nocardia uniformis]NNH69548.1 glycosyltransferase family 39 protein [Nocardia uniformis]